MSTRSTRTAAAAAAAAPMSDATDVKTPQRQPKLKRVPGAPTKGKQYAKKRNGATPVAQFIEPYTPEENAEANELAEIDQKMASDEPPVDTSGLKKNVHVSAQAVGMTWNPREVEIDDYSDMSQYAKDIEAGGSESRGRIRGHLERRGVQLNNSGSHGQRFLFAGEWMCQRFCLTEGQFAEHCLVFQPQRAGTEGVILQWNTMCEMAKYYKTSQALKLQSNSSASAASAAVEAVAAARVSASDSDDDKEPNDVPDLSGFEAQRVDSLIFKGVKLLPGIDASVQQVYGAYHDWREAKYQTITEKGGTWEVRHTFEVVDYGRTYYVVKSGETCRFEILKPYKRLFEVTCREKQAAFEFMGGDFKDLHDVSIAYYDREGTARYLDFDTIRDIRFNRGVRLLAVALYEYLDSDDGHSAPAFNCCKRLWRMHWRIIPYKRQKAMMKDHEQFGELIVKFMMKEFRPRKDDEEVESEKEITRSDRFF